VPAAARALQDHFPSRVDQHVLLPPAAHGGWQVLTFDFLLFGEVRLRVLGTSMFCVSVASFEVTVFSEQRNGRFKHANRRETGGHSQGSHPLAISLCL
jgi:hypothetical protein